MPHDPHPARFDDSLHPQGGLLDVAGIDAIVAEAPTDPLDFQRAVVTIPFDERPTMGSWLGRFDAGRRAGCGLTEIRRGAPLHPA